MRQITTGVRSILSQPTIYELWSQMVGGDQARTIFVNRHVRPDPSDSVLDLGCGTGELANHFPANVHYCGIDISNEYVARARKRLGDQATLRVGDASTATEDLGRFELVVAYGLLHHLDDEQVRQLFRNAASVLTLGGRVVTADPVFTSNQSYARRTLMKRDRGQHIRTASAYAALAESTFKSVQCSVYHDLLRLPYSHCILECTQPDVTDPADRVVSN
jgi:cyclopropane fatty-acyl-phospholipid synthase-like methyltransferase